MKRILSVILILLLLAGCGSKTETTSKKEDGPIKGDDCPYLTAGQWEGNDGSCTNTIRFGEDFGFSNFCACGEPIGYADLLESYRYRASDGALLLYDGNDKLLETGSVIYVDSAYLIVKLFDTIFYYENQAARLPSVPDNLKTMVGLGGLTAPYVAILGYENGKLEIGHCNKGADGDTAVLNTADNVQVMSMTNNVDGALTLNTPTVEELCTEGMPSQGLIYLDENGDVVGIYLYDQV